MPYDTGRIPVNHGKATDKMTLGEVIANIASDNPVMQQLAVLAAERFGKSAAPMLVDVMKKGNSNEIRAQATDALQKILRNPENRDDSILGELEGIAATASPYAAGRALDCIGYYRGNPKARKIMMAILTKSPNAHLRGVAIRNFQRVEESTVAARAILRKSLEDQSPLVQLYAAKALGRIGDSAGAGVVERVLRSTENSDEATAYRSLAAEAAAEIGDSRLLPVLKEVQAGKFKEGIEVTLYQSVASIHLKNQPDSKKINFLEESLADPVLVGWAGRRLAADHSAEAVAALKRAAENPKHPARIEAERWYKAALKAKL